MNEQQQSTEVEVYSAGSTSGIMFFLKRNGWKIVFTVILALCALISFGPLASTQQGRNSQVDKALQAQSSNDIKEEKIQSALTKKSRQILTVWVAMKGVSGLINVAQSVEIGLFGTSVNPAEILAPLDNTLDKISNILLWALGAVLFEKLLLAISGYVVFKVVIPACLLVAIVAVLKSNGKAILKVFAVTIVTCLVVRFAVPLSFDFSNVIERNLFSNEIERVMTKISNNDKQAKQQSEAMKKMKAQPDETKKTGQTIKEQAKDNNKDKPAKQTKGNWFTRQVSNAMDLGNALIEDLITFLMIFILTNIAIPILTILGLYWFTKYLARVIMGPGRGGGESNQNIKAPERKYVCK
jgi:predicted metalloprotease